MSDFSIPFSSIVFGSRERTTYTNIDSLAESIRDVGLQCPIILSPLPDGKFRLEDGGRRYRALESLGVTELFHGATSSVGRPGFVLKSEVSSNESAWLTELIANMHRENFDWRDELRLIVKAYREQEKKANAQGKDLYYSTFGKMLGNYNHADINAAVNVHDEVVANPEKFSSCESILHAYSTMLKDSKAVLEKQLAERRKANVIQLPERPSVQADGQPQQQAVAPVSFDVNSVALFGNSIDHLESLPAGSFDHIVCDPDFAVSVEDLSANNISAVDGVIQSSVEDSLSDLKRFIAASFSAVRDGGFLVFFYDLNHHEKLLSWCAESGWRVQRWPIIWHKMDYRSNGAPNHNSCKNIEYAMVCRKPSAVLNTVTMSSIFPMPTGNTTKVLGHPFAKPIGLWTSIFKMVAQPGQSVFDPFMGAGSSVIAGLRYGLHSSGMELNPDHHAKAIINISRFQELTLS